MRIIDLAGEKATRCNVQDFLPTVSAKDCCRVVIYAHGDLETKRAIIGQCQHRPLFDSENSYLLCNKAVFAGACYVGHKLGQDILDGGASCFIGFKGRILLPADREKEIIDCINEGALKFIEAPEKPEEACEAILRAVRRLEEQLETETGGDVRMAMAIQHIRRGLVCKKPPSGLTS